MGTTTTHPVLYKITVCSLQSILSALTFLLDRVNHIIYFKGYVTFNSCMSLTFAVARQVAFAHFYLRVIIRNCIHYKISL